MRFRNDLESLSLSFFLLSFLFLSSHPLPPSRRPENLEETKFSGVENCIDEGNSEEENSEEEEEKEEGGGVRGKKRWLKREVCGRVQRNDESLRWLCLDEMELRFYLCFCFHSNSLFFFRFCV